MTQHLASVTLVVNDYDEAIAFYVHKLGFELLEDSLQGAATLSDAEKRWVIVSPPGATETRLLLAKADGAEQSRFVGNQAGGRVMFILFTDDFWRDYETYREQGVEFVRGEPRKEAYGTVAVFRDLYGNLWDLLEPS